MNIQFIPVKTRPFLPPKDDFWKLAEESLPKLKDGDVLFVTSKIVAIHQGRCVRMDSGVNKDDLIRKEAERYIPRRRVPHALAILTIKQYTLIPSAGIDESNASGHYILWPRNINGFAKELHQRLTKKFRIQRLGIVVTDSHTTPLRWGVTGSSIGFYGIEPLYDYRGKFDIFGRKLKMTQVNVVDAISAMAVLLMGEGSERQPMLVMRGARFARFTNKNRYKNLVISPSEDIYRPLFGAFLKGKAK